MEEKPLTIYGYELTTPKFQGKSTDAIRFDHELFGYFFSKIISDLSIENRAFKDKKRMINLTEFKHSDDAAFFEGIFITARYGKEQEILDVPKQKAAGVKPKSHGVKNDVHFLVDKKTGLLLLEKDTEQVAGADIIRRFINYHRNLIEDYLVAFNKKFDPVKMHRRGFLKISSLPPKSFFEEIREFSTIKDAYFYLDISSVTPTSNEASNLMYLYDKAKKNGVKNVNRVKISFESTVPKMTIRGVESYFKKIFEAQYYDGMGVKGKTYSGRYRTIELENIQRTFDIIVNYNENGLPSLSDMINGMVDIAKNNNPIKHKLSVDQYRGVVLSDEEEDKEV